MTDFGINKGGMSKRDWFAGMALAGFAAAKDDGPIRLADGALPNTDHETIEALELHWNHCARAAYIAADAMLAASEADNG